MCTLKLLDLFDSFSTGHAIQSMQNKPIDNKFLYLNEDISHKFYKDQGMVTLQKIES